MAPLVLMRRMVGLEFWGAISATVGAAVVAAIGDGPPVMRMPAWLTVGTAR
jgi:hypothetical protein